MEGTAFPASNTAIHTVFVPKRVAVRSESGQRD